MKKIKLVMFFLGLTSALILSGSLQAGAQKVSLKCNANDRMTKIKPGCTAAHPKNC